MSPPAWLLGLRTRFLVAFLLVAVLSGSATATASYVTARRAVLEGAQQQNLDQARTALDSLASSLRYPLDQAALEAVVKRVGHRVGDQVIAAYGDLQAPKSGFVDPIPAALKRAVTGSRQAKWQRVNYAGLPYFVSATPVLRGDGLPSGLVVYVQSLLIAEEDYISALARSAALTLIYCLLGAVLLALLAARGAPSRPRPPLRGAQACRRGARHQDRGPWLR